MKQIRKSSAPVRISTQTPDEVDTSRLAQEKRVRGKHSVARPNQAPPLRLVQQQRDADVDDEYQEDEPSTSGRSEEESQRPHHSTGTTHQERIHRKAENWESRRPTRLEQLRLYEVQKGALDQAHASCIADLLQQRIQLSLQQHHCCASLGQPQLTVVDKRTVLYHSADVTVELQVPTVECSLCARRWEVDACECGCFPSSPVIPQRWYASATLDLYTSLAYTAAVSTTHFAASLEDVYRQGGKDVSVDDR